MALLESPIIAKGKNSSFNIDRVPLDCLKCQNPHLNGSVDIVKYLENFCQNNQIESFKQIYSDYFNNDDERDIFCRKFKVLKLFEYACLHDRLKIATWIYSKTEFLSEPSYRSSIVCLFHGTIREGYLEISKWIFRTFSIEKKETKSSIFYVYNDCLLDAISYNHIEIVKWLLSVFKYEWKEIQSEIQRKCPQDVQKIFSEYFSN